MERPKFLEKRCSYGAFTLFMDDCSTNRIQISLDNKVVWRGIQRMLFSCFFDSVWKYLQNDDVSTGISINTGRFIDALNSQPTWQLLDNEAFYWIGRAIYAVGLIFTLASFYRLKITGTYLGDYFGILMDEKIEGFPFNVLENPMYMGGTMMFVGDAIMYFLFYLKDNYSGTRVLQDLYSLSFFGLCTLS